MKAGWKPFLVWSSIGGLALGATMALAKRTRKHQVQPLISERLPEDCRRLTIWTERFQVKGNDHRFSAHDKYNLQLTPFRVWSVLDISPSSDWERKAGTPIYHVTHVRLVEVKEGEGFRDDEETLDRFYATLTALDESGKSFAKNSIARGGVLQFHKCNVGGAVNGVETGDVHRSAARVLNYRCEFTEA